MHGVIFVTVTKNPTHFETQSVFLNVENVNSGNTHRKITKVHRPGTMDASSEESVFEIRNLKL